MCLMFKQAKLKGRYIYNPTTIKITLCILGATGNCILNLNECMYSGPCDLRPLCLQLPPFYDQLSVTALMYFQFKYFSFLRPPSI